MAAHVRCQGGALQLSKLGFCLLSNGMDGATVSRLWTQGCAQLVLGGSLVGILPWWRLEFEVVHGHLLLWEWGGCGG
jgi:hypothetical protein